MNPRARRIRRQRRKDRVRDAEAAKEEVEAFIRSAREAERAAARRAAHVDRKAAPPDPNHELRVASPIKTGAGLFAEMTRALPKI
jgi:hypothetical protein